MSSWGVRSTDWKVLLHIYDLHPANQYVHAVGLGAYHSGVEVGGREYTFAGGAGIFDTHPKEAPGAVYRETIEMGVIKDGPRTLARALEILRGDFGPESYNILTKNCNHFANELCTQLVGRGIPGFINRLAFMGSFFSCFLPREMVQDAPVNIDGSGGGHVASGGEGGAGGANGYRAFAGEGQKLGAPAAAGEDPDARREAIRKAALTRATAGPAPPTPVSARGAAGSALL